ncbi:HNH endonuclease [Roseomonas chloroacetimidivorans]|uniref:HNH endonuclease n=1 Tax=Roseomonas chloroacetimidivorans TaxID=1766656 RepID=UPI003C7746E7
MLTIVIPGEMRGVRPLPPVDRLRSRLAYCPTTGVLRWRHTRPGPKSRSDDAGCVKPDGYRYVRFEGGNYLAHRLIWLMMTGDEPGRFIDHINGEPSDNRWANLRLASHAENMRNSRMQRNNTSGFKGVRYDRARQRWIAEIKKDGRTIRLGRFGTAEAAGAARAAAAAELHGEFARSPA